MIESNMPLNAVSMGRSAEIKDVVGSEIMCKKLMEMGLSKGTIIEIMNNDIGHLVVKLGETRLVLGRSMAQKVMVREV
ncbi:FeoA family protein [Clostridium ljungdahlii]|uniref:FeoA domain protein n=1 Tax=Clostridium ljungdahlii TaxID=1538 RepID=A0A166RRM2_9CLOT|nr:FeoA domain-containing protein [Clostridium ljungdahlii]OAA91038.1 FeoA domain protein [Clostridium ljungdahlii]